jgi:hypothetical protein
MTYMRFTPVARNTWEVFTPVKSSERIATIWKSRGQCRAVLNEDHAVSPEELDSLSVFMRAA